MKKTHTVNLFAAMDAPLPKDFWQEIGALPNDCLRLKEEEGAVSCKNVLLTHGTPLLKDMMERQAQT